MSDDEWYESDDTVDRLLGLLDDADKTPVERLREQVQKQQAVVKRAYSQLQAANAEFQSQQQLLNSKQRELSEAQYTAATKPKTGVDQYLSELRKSRQGMTFNQWQQDASKNKERHRLYKMYGKLIKDKLVNPMQMPAFGKYPGEK